MSLAFNAHSLLHPRCHFPRDAQHRVDELLIDVHVAFILGEVAFSMRTRLSSCGWLIVCVDQNQVLAGKHAGQEGVTAGFSVGEFLCRI